MAGRRPCGHGVEAGASLGRPARSVGVQSRRRRREAVHCRPAGEDLERRQVTSFMSVASEPMKRAMVLALETGQRQGDLITPGLGRGA